MQTHHKPPLPPPLSVSQPSPSPPPYRNSDESPHSPLRSHSPHLSDDHDHDHDHYNNNGAIIPVENFFSPINSPFPETSPKDMTTPDNFSSPPRQFLHLNVREDAPPQSGVVYGGGGGGGGGGERKGRGSGVRFGGTEDIVRRKQSGKMIEKVNLGVRVLEIIFCLISFSVMAADKTQGWSGDSFDRYKEYRFCLSVNVLGFVYAAFQAYDAGNHLATGKHVINHHLRYQFDFIMDQILAYLLISASSAAASRVDDWQANWGKDEFTEKASASVSMAFLAFLGFAMTSLISGYNLCNRDLS